MNTLKKVTGRFFLACCSVRLLAALFLAISATASVRAADIIAGPMLGHITDTSARIWLQLSTPADVIIEANDVDRNRSVGRIRLPIEGPWPFILDTPVGGLEPNRNYRVSILIDGKPAKYAGTEIQIRTAPSPGEPDAFTVALGSNFEPKNTDNDLFRNVQSLRPRAFVFLGNAGFFPAAENEWPEMRRAAYRMMSDTHRRTRIFKGLEPLMRTTAMYAVWGDRDYGLTAAGKDWVYKQESLVSFQRFWPNPFYGTPETPGLYCNFVISDAEFFLLDTRYYRDADTAADRRGMLGEGQLAWLKSSLQQSRATFKVIASPSPVLPRYAGAAGSWMNYPEGQSFIQWLMNERIPGVVFVSGGTLFGELTLRRPAEGGTDYPLVDLSTARLSPAEAAIQGFPDNPDRMGDVVSEPNFATLDFGGPRSQRFITFRLRDAKGTIRVERRAFATELR